MHLHPGEDASLDCSPAVPVAYDFEEVPETNANRSANRTYCCERGCTKTAAARIVASASLGADIASCSMLLV